MMKLTNIPNMSTTSTSTSTIVVYCDTTDDEKNTLVLHSRDSKFDHVFGYKGATRLNLADLMENNTHDSLSDLFDMVQTGKSLNSVS